MDERNQKPYFLLIYFLMLLGSFLNPHDRFTWWLEAFPALLGLLVLVITYRKFPFTRLVYVLILIHACILFVGAHYTYAEVPLFNWIREILHQSRNNYDKLGHFAQGFIPAIIAREILIRKQVVNGKVWLFVMVTCFCLAFSAAFELFEWLVSVLVGQGADAYLGVQGYVWDTQSDMLYAWIGAMLAQLFLSGWHDRQMESMSKKGTD